MRIFKSACMVCAILLVAGCGRAAPLPASPIPTTASPLIPTQTTTPSFTPTETLPPSETPTPTASATPIASLTSFPTLTPTSEFPLAVVTEARAFCRYGPGKAYLYSHELNEGNQVQVQGRNPSKTWLWVQPPNLDRHCWAAASVLRVAGDLSTLKVVASRLPHTTLYGPPDSVDASREGDEVTVEWEDVWMTVDDFRGYLIEARVCQGGSLVSVAVQTDDTSYTLNDEPGCSGTSEGKLYAVDKHGYTDPVDIPWPEN